MQVASLYFPDAVGHPGGGRRRERRCGRGAYVARITLAVAEFNEHDGISEVHLSFGGRTGVGRAGSGPLIGGAEATLGALRDLGKSSPST